MSRFGRAARGITLSRALGAVLAAVLAVALSPAASTAQASPPPASAPEAEPATDLIAPAFDTTFDRVLTNGIWSAAAVSRTALVTYCHVSVPSFLRSACVYIAESSLYSALVRMGPPNGRCLKVEPRFGIPPFRLSYTTCP